MTPLDYRSLLVLGINCGWWVRHNSTIPDWAVERMANDASQLLELLLLVVVALDVSIVPVEGRASVHLDCRSYGLAVPAQCTSPSCCSNARPMPKSRCEYDTPGRHEE